MTATKLANRAVIRLTPTEYGEDVTEFLQGLVTSDVAGTLPVWTALLTPQGKALYDFIVWSADDGALLIDCEAEFAEALAKRLSLYRLRRKIAIKVDQSLSVRWQKEAVENAVPDPRLGDLGYRWLSPSAADAETADDAWRAHRLSLGVPEGRAELGDGETLWLECNAAELQGVSFEKGCYVGQENTARMNWRQKINRRLIVVSLERSDLKRQKAAYPDLGLAVDHLRVADLDADLLPIWLKL